MELQNADNFKEWNVKGLSSRAPWPRKGFCDISLSVAVNRAAWLVAEERRRQSDLRACLFACMRACVRGVALCCCIVVVLTPLFSSFVVFVESPVFFRRWSIDNSSQSFCCLFSKQNLQTLDANVDVDLCGGWWSRPAVCLRRRMAPAMLSWIWSSILDVLWLQQLKIPQG